MAVWRKVGVVAAALLLAGAPVFFARAPQTAAQGGASLQPDPLVLIVGAGRERTLQIRVANIQHLYAAEIHLQFDPAVVEVVDADPLLDGVQISPGVFPLPDSIMVNLADNLSGTIDYGVTSVFPTAESNGSGVVCSITFRGLAAGQTTLLALRSSPETILAVVDGATIGAAPYVWQDAAIRVNYVLYLPFVVRMEPLLQLYLPFVVNNTP